MQYGIRFTYVNGTKSEIKCNTEKDRDEVFEALKSFDWNECVELINVIVNLRNVICCEKFERQNT